MDRVGGGEIGVDDKLDVRVVGSHRVADEVLLISDDNHDVADPAGRRG